MSTTPNPASEPAAPPPEGNLAFVCPYCHSERPMYVFERTDAPLPVGSVSYITVFCGYEKCRKILGVTVLQFETNDDLIARARRAGIVL